MAFPLLGNPKETFLDSSGNPLASGTLAVLDPADDTNKASYPTADDADAATNANVNPVVLDARGEPPNGLFGRDGEDYKLVLKDSTGTTVWTVDDVRVPIALPYTETANETAAAVTPTDLGYEPGDVRRYGATGDGTTDDASSIGTAVSSTHTVLFDGNLTYRVDTASDGVLITSDNVHLIGDYESAVFSDTTDYRAITVGNLTDDIVSGLSIVGIEAYNTTTNDNRQTLKTGGVENVLWAFNHVSTGFYAFGPHYSSSVATAGQERRTSQMRHIANYAGPNVAGTGLEVFGVWNSSFVGQVNYKTGTRASAHGVRLTGYGTDDATNSNGSDLTNRGNVVAATSTWNWQTAYSSQLANFTSVVVGGTLVGGNALWSETGNSTTVGSQSRNIVVSALAAEDVVGGCTLEKTERHIFTGIAVADFDDAGFDHKVAASSATFGTGKYCRFDGLLTGQRNATSHAARFQGDNTRISLTLADIQNIDSVIIDGDHNIIDVIVGENSDADSRAIRVNGDDNIVLIAADGMTANTNVRIDGNNNDVLANLDTTGTLGRVQVDGTGNSIRGNCDLGSVAAGNDVTGVFDARRRDSVSDTTDGSGDITITHGLIGADTSFIVTAVATGTTFSNVQVHTKTTTTFKIRFFDAAGAAQTSTAVTCDWRAEQDYG